MLSDKSHQRSPVPGIDVTLGDELDTRTSELEFVSNMLNIFQIKHEILCPLRSALSNRN